MIAAALFASQVIDYLHKTYYFIINHPDRCNRRRLYNGKTSRPLWEFPVLMLCFAMDSNLYCSLFCSTEMQFYVIAVVVGLVMGGFNR
jgi:hypothetical protein